MTELNALERLEKKIDELRADIYEFRAETQQEHHRFAQYFVGMNPDDHVRHHMEYNQCKQKQSQWSDTKRTIVNGVLITVIGSILISVFTWTIQGAFTQIVAAVVKEMKK